MTRILIAILVLLAACSEETVSPEGPEPPVAPEPGRTFLDLPYANVSAAQRLDLYLPPTGEGPFPLVVWVHGGGWQGGDKALGPFAFQRRLTDRGYALASVNYRLSGEAIFPAQIHDVKAAVRWLRANAARYRLDPNRFGAWGSSAGGHLVALLGTSGGDPSLEGSELGNAGTSSRVQAVVDWFGPVDFLQMGEHAAANGCPPEAVERPDAPDSPESKLIGEPIDERPDLVAAASPLSYVSADDPPYLIEHGTLDCLVPPLQSDLLEETLEPLLGDARVTLIFLPEGHGGPVFQTPANLELVFGFFDDVLR